MRRKLDIEIKAGIFVLMGALLCLAMALLIGAGSNLFDRSFTIHVVVDDAMGLSRGAMIRSGGLKIGRVSNIEFSEDYGNIRVSMLIAEKYRQRIRQDSFVRFQTQGMLGDKYLEIVGGSQSAAVIPVDAILQAEASKDLSAVLTDSQSAIQLLKDNLANLKQISGSFVQNRQNEKFFSDLSQVASNLKDITAQLKSSNTVADLGIAAKNFRVVSDRVKNGEGTVGALFTDASLYEDMKSLIGGANRNNVLKFFVRQAVKSSDEATKEKATEEKSVEDKKK